MIWPRALFHPVHESCQHKPKAKTLITMRGWSLSQFGSGCLLQCWRWSTCHSVGGGLLVTVLVVVRLLQCWWWSACYSVSGGPLGPSRGTAPALPPLPAQ
jgi:hypothetical protein